MLDVQEYEYDELLLIFQLLLDIRCPVKWPSSPNSTLAVFLYLCSLDPKSLFFMFFHENPSFSEYFQVCLKYRVLSGAANNESRETLLL